MHAATASRVKVAELTSTVGAGVLGVGLGVLLASFRVFAIPLLITGLALHAWGMSDKHRVEDAAVRPAWSTALYWICWLGLVGIAIAMVANALR